MTRFVRHYLLALQFFTRIPVTGRLADWVGYSPAMLRASAAHLPGIGWLVGGLTSALLAALLWALPMQPAAPWLAAVLCTVFSVMLTGAFHEDGLADLADGLGGSYQRDRALEIMKDSRIGSFGAIALVLVLIAKCASLALLAQVEPLFAVAGLFAAQVISRQMPLVIILTLPHVGNDAGSKSKPLADQISRSAFLTGVLWCVVALALLYWLSQPMAWGQSGIGLAGCAGALLACAWMRRLLAGRLQGFTGDGLGATQQISEMGFYVGLLLAAGAMGVT